MDVHLKIVHKLVKGTRIFENMLREATIFVETKKNDDLHRALVDYG
jgi:hypothetical protein